MFVLPLDEFKWFKLLKYLSQVLCHVYPEWGKHSYNFTHISDWLECHGNDWWSMTVTHFMFMTQVMIGSTTVFNSVVVSWTKYLKKNLVYAILVGYCRKGLLQNNYLECLKKIWLSKTRGNDFRADSCIIFPSISEQNWVSPSSLKHNVLVASWQWCMDYGNEKLFTLLAPEVNPCDAELKAWVLHTSTECIPGAPWPKASPEKCCRKIPEALPLLSSPLQPWHPMPWV